MKRTRTPNLGSAEAEAMAALGQRLRRARLRRNLSQVAMAERMGVTRKVVTALEAGSDSSSLASLVRALAVLGYPQRVAELMSADPIGDDFDEVLGRHRAGRQESGVADF